MKGLKNFVKVLLVSLLALTLVACGNGDGGDTAEGEAKTYEIGVAIYRFDDNFMTSYRKEIEAGFEELAENDGNTYNLDIQDGKQDQATQTEQINNFIAQEKDLIIANMVDPTAAGSLIESAKEADIPIIFINREPEPQELEKWPGKTTYIGVDATQSGEYQGEIIAELEDKGDLNGDGVVNYIMLQGDPANVDAIQRTEFSIKKLTELGVESKALAEPYLANWDAAKGQEFTASALDQFGDDLEVIFSNNDAMAMGAIQSIEAAGRKVNEDIYLVGVDAIDDAIKQLEDGNLTGTVLNDHFNQARTVVDIAKEALEGKEISAYYWHDYVKVTKPEDAELKRAEYRTETVEEVVKRYEERAK